MLHILCLVAAMAAVAMGSPVTSDYCYPGASCFPDTQTLIDLYRSLDGSVIFPTDQQYQNLTIMKDTAYIEFPAFICLALTTLDIQKCLKFAHDYNMKISVQSSGHDYIGRSTAHGSLQINLSNMTNIHVNLSSRRHPAGEITVESGNNWLRVYTEVDKHNRVIVGGSAHTVAMGGYTLGGGHSPISRLHGLAVDNLLEAEVIIANGSIVTVNENMTKMVDTTGKETVSSDTSLFWALRGGGGGTFGIVSKFTFKLHMAPKAVQRAICQFALYENTQPIGLTLLRKWNDVLATSLAPEWGGYTLYSGDPIKGTNYTGLVTLALNHMGEYGTPSFNTIYNFINFYKQFTDYEICKFQNFTRFLEYEVGAKDPLYYNSYVMNILTQPDTTTDDFYAMILSNILTRPTPTSGFGCTATSLGGKVKDVGPDDTPLNPGFRTATTSLTCGIAFSGLDFDIHFNAAKEIEKKFLTYGKGSYLNEASEYLPDWKTAYWGNHYGRLLEIKKAWDPTNVFSCHHCVGSDTMTPGGDPLIG